MKRSSRNPSKNVLRRIYAFALGAAISTVGFSMYRATTPGVQEPEIRTLSMNETGTVSIEEMEEAVCNPEVRPLAELATFQRPSLIGDTFFTNKESQEQETEEFPQEFVGDLFAQVDVSEAVEEGFIAVEASIEEKLESFEEEEVEDAEVSTTVVASAAPKTGIERMEATEDHVSSTNVTKAMTIPVEAPVEAPVVEEAIVIDEVIINEAVVENLSESIINENIVTENIVEGIPAEVMETPAIVDESIVVDEVIAEGIISGNEPNINCGNWGPDSPLFSPSGLTAEQIGKVLAGTNMEGLENVVYETEQKYGINACILLAIACNESGYGASRMAKRQNNLFGMMGMKFNSLEENIDYFGQLMVKYRDQWHKTMTANGICRAYVGQNENTAGWPKKITGIMNQIYAKATK